MRDRRYNSQAFTPREVEKGLHLKFIECLLEISRELEDSFLDIHITTDGYCTIIQWADCDSDISFGTFKFVGEDEVVMLERVFPDNHTELCFSEEDFEERLKNFLKENPGWVKTAYGTWTNEIENVKFMKEVNSSEDD